MILCILLLVFFDFYQKKVICTEKATEVKDVNDVNLDPTNFDIKSEDIDSCYLYSLITRNSNSTSDIEQVKFAMKNLIYQKPQKKNLILIDMEFYGDNEMLDSECYNKSYDEIFLYQLFTKEEFHSMLNQSDKTENKYDLLEKQKFIVKKEFHCAFNLTIKNFTSDIDFFINSNIENEPFKKYESAAQIKDSEYKNFLKNLRILGESEYILNNLELLYDYLTARDLFVIDYNFGISYSICIFSKFQEEIENLSNITYSPTLYAKEEEQNNGMIVNETMISIFTQKKKFHAIKNQKDDINNQFIRQKCKLVEKNIIT